MNQRRPQRSQTNRGRTVSVDQLLGSGYDNLRRGRIGQAESCFSQMTIAHRNNPEGWRGLGHVAMAQSKHDTAVEHFQKAVKADPTRGELHGELGRALQLVGRIDDALLSLQRATGNDPSYINGWCGQAEILERQGMYPQAHKALEKALKAEPESDMVKLLLARLHHRQGRHDDAATSLQDLVASCDDPRFLAQAHILLARTLDRQGEYEQAFQHANKGKAVLAKNTANLDQLRAASNALDAYKVQSFDDLDEARIDSWNKSPIEQTQSVAFIVGFPRSGTTLMERVLDAHPGIVATDESPIIGSLWTQVRQLDASNPHLLDVLDKIPQDELVRLQKTYFQMNERLIGQPIGTRMLVDKMPLNLMAVPLIARVFPRARLIYADRDPRDIAISCFMRLGERPDVGSVEFLTMEGCVSRYDRVARVWDDFQARCPLPSLRVRYEDVVRDLEKQSRRMAEFLDLEWDESMLRFSETREGVYLNAPTHEDVGQQLFVRSLDRWRQYPFAFSKDQFSVLSPHIQDLGYDTTA